MPVEPVIVDPVSDEMVLTRLFDKSLRDDWRKIIVQKSELNLNNEPHQDCHQL